VIKQVTQFVKQLGKVPLVCKDSPGFLINRLKAALVNEAITLLSEGVASAETIDDAVRLGFAPRFALYGPLLSNDLTGKKSTTLAVTGNIYERLGREQFMPPKALEEKVKSGDLGIEFGGGWYKLGPGGDEKIKDILSKRNESLSRIYKFLEELEGSSGVKLLRNAGTSDKA
jgi:3-hydroxybutyryl-CoA dehydrogenase